MHASGLAVVVVTPQKKKSTGEPCRPISWFAGLGAGADRPDRPGRALRLRAPGTPSYCHFTSPADSLRHPSYGNLYSESSVWASGRSWIGPSASPNHDKIGKIQRTTLNIITILILLLYYQ